MKKSFADILSETASRQREKMRSKAPQWYACEGLVYPTALSTEQCSSTLTATYKSGLIEKVAGDGKARSPKHGIADLTGGLGVDSWAFSQVADKVFYNEMNPELAEAARNNFRLLGRDNIEISNLEVSESNIDGILEESGADIVYMDPARRSETGGKVFRIADCTPNVLGLLPHIFNHCDTLLLKLSPMADISLCVKELNAAAEAGETKTGAARATVSEVHVVGVGRECKELLILMEKGCEGGYAVSAVQLSEGAAPAVLTFTPDQESSARAIPAQPRPGDWLFEPSAALQKAGAFRLISERHSLGKLAPSAQLYTAAEPVLELENFGKWLRITDIRPFSSRTIKDLGKEFPRADLTARNLPLTTDVLRKKMGITASGDTHIYAVGTPQGNLFLITE